MDRATDAWSRFGFTIAMPHMVPDKLSEVELLKHFGSHQWEHIAQSLGCPSHELVNGLGERLYASFIDIELALGPHTSLDGFGEGTKLHARNRIQVFAKQYVEGFFVFDGEEIDDEQLTEIRCRDDLYALERPWAYMTNAFVARAAGNSRLKVFKPKGIEGGSFIEADNRPAGIDDHQQAQSTGWIAPFADYPDARELAAGGELLIPYEILPESDMNGAGLLYFARYVAMLNYAERIVLTRLLCPPLSHELVARLSTERRRIFYYANADPTDTVNIHVKEAVAFPCARRTPSHHTPLGMTFRADLYRESDGALMASSLVQKGLNVPGRAKNIAAEAKRLLHRLSG